MQSRLVVLNTQQIPSGFSGKDSAKHASVLVVWNPAGLLEYSALRDAKTGTESIIFQSFMKWLYRNSIVQTYVTVADATLSTAAHLLSLYADPSLFLFWFVHALMYSVGWGGTTRCLRRSADARLSSRQRRKCGWRGRGRRGRISWSCSGSSRRKVFCYVRHGLYWPVVSEFDSHGLRQRIESARSSTRQSSSVWRC